MNVTNTPVSVPLYFYFVCRSSLRPGYRSRGTPRKKREGSPVKKKNEQRWSWDWSWARSSPVGFPSSSSTSWLLYAANTVTSRPKPSLSPSGSVIWTPPSILLYIPFSIRTSDELSGASYSNDKNLAGRIPPSCLSILVSSRSADVLFLSFIRRIILGKWLRRIISFVVFPRIFIYERNISFYQLHDRNIIELLINDLISN